MSQKRYSVYRVNGKHERYKDSRSTQQFDAPGWNSSQWEEVYEIVQQKRRTKNGNKNTEPVYRP